MEKGPRIAVFQAPFSAKELLEAVNSRAEGVEVVITARMADNKVIDNADLVTEMRENKYYYQEGITARGGIRKIVLMEVSKYSGE